ncbi:hypothetical protein [Novosphingobium sp. CCH12-A3]|uniref:hypothetical protein n=1 Tax=Novosphingobium sp. CCH12-A3 TaxID=1768752 RepID=UPI0012E3843F|nr:hypothetical protein [Novosphingobium sp. CCH12-A3]
MAKPITDIVTHVDNGTAFPLADGEMDFHNSFQLRSSVRHIICPLQVFALAKRFMADNPGHKGRRIKFN